MVIIEYDSHEVTKSETCEVVVGSNIYINNYCIL